MTKIFATIIAFLLMLFPESGILQIYQWQLDFPGTKDVAEEIIDAINEKDFETLINMYSESAKSTGEVTEENLEIFINAIKGDIIEAKFNGADGGDHIAYGSGDSDRTIRIRLETTEGVYKIYASWVIVDTENPENIGLMQLTLFPNNVSWENYEGPLAQIPLKESFKEARY